MNILCDEGVDSQIVAQLRREYNEAQQAMKAKVEAHGVRDPSD